MIEGYEQKEVTIHFKTDLEKLESIFNEFGIGYEKCDGENEILIVLAAAGMWHKEYEKVEGYSDFHCIYKFTPEGKFINVGIWE